MADVWNTNECAERILDTRSSIPLASEQIDVMMRVTRKVLPEINNFMDLGCGYGILGSAVMKYYPNSEGIFLDNSEIMLDKARKHVGKTNVRFIKEDFTREGWEESFHKKLDLIVSGFAIHHQPDSIKRKIYKNIYDLLRPGGLFLHLEHVASEARWIEDVFEDHFVDAIHGASQKKGIKKSREKLFEEFKQRADKKENILTLLDIQKEWMRDVGFADVECFFKVFEIALFGGIKPQRAVRA